MTADISLAFEPIANKFNAKKIYLRKGNYWGYKSNIRCKLFVNHNLILVQDNRKGKEGETLELLKIKTDSFAYKGHYKYSLGIHSDTYDVIFIFLEKNNNDFDGDKIIFKDLIENMKNISS